MKVYNAKNNLYKNIFCMVLIFQLSFLYFFTGMHFVDEVSTHNHQTQTNGFRSTYRIKRHIKTFVRTKSESDEYSEKQSTSTLNKSCMKRINNRIRFYRFCAVLLLFSGLIEVYYVAFYEDVRHFAFHILSFMHQSDGKKRIFDFLFYEYST